MPRNIARFRGKHSILIRQLCSQYTVCAPKCTAICKERLPTPPEVECAFKPDVNLARARGRSGADGQMCSKCRRSTPVKISSLKELHSVDSSLKTAGKPRLPANLEYCFYAVGRGAGGPTSARKTLPRMPVNEHCL